MAGLTIGTHLFAFMFGLDPQSIANRARMASTEPLVPTLAQSLARGMIGFTLVSLGGFGPWILAGRWFYRNTGELGLYVACFLVFLGLSGALLHRLIIPPGSLARFYKVFSLAFGAYAVVWIVCWMALGGAVGGVAGALAGMAAMGGMLALCFGVPKAIWEVVAALFLTNLAGYFVGEWAHNAVRSVAQGGLASKAVWGLCYGLSSGAGIGLAFYICQAEARRLLRSPGTLASQAHTPSATTSADSP